MLDLLRLGAAFMLLMAWGCVPGQADTPTDIQPLPPSPVKPGFLHGDAAEAQAIMDSLSMVERIAQIMMVPLYSRPDEPGSALEVSRWIEEHGVGGVIAMQGDKDNTRKNLAWLDSLAEQRSEIGLLTAMDAEWGSGMRLPDGIRFPKAMALGAIQDVDLLRAVGHMSGEELRQLGIDMDFAPVVDVNSNPANPVIGNRSFGSDPHSVGTHALAWAEGLREAGVMACGKHFPGHGDADLDSHHALPLIASDSAHLASTELPPFKQLIEGGVEAIMTAHLQVPALDSLSGMPTSLSPVVIGDWLLDSLGFEGLVFTDALSMAGVADPVPPGTREIAALNAGNDVLLFPSEPSLVIDSVLAALQTGRLDTARVNQACMKVLMAKLWSPPSSTSPPAEWPNLQRAVREHMITRMGPAHHSRPGDATSLVIIGNRGRALERRMKAAFPRVEVLRLGKGTLTSGDIQRITEGVTGQGHVWVAFLDESNRPSRNFGIPSGAERLIEALAEMPLDLDVGLFTSPYGLGHLPNPENTGWLIAFHEDPLTQECAAAAWCSEGPALGRLPVDVHPWTSGMGRPFRATRPARATSPHSRLKARLDSLAEVALQLDAVPGLRLVVLASDSLIYNGAHGVMGDADQTPVSTEAVYDLASITKVAATTLVTMMTVERGMMDLDAPIKELLPADPMAPLDVELGQRSFRDILAHRSGLPAWIPFYADLVAYSDSTGEDLTSKPRPDWVEIHPGRWMNPAWRDSIRQEVRALTPKPRGAYRYSDLGYYLLQDALEHLWKKPLDVLADSLIYAPLGLERMGYRPLEWSEMPIIAPTELDTVFRDTLVQGCVHDPGAAMYGGVAGHAGLFSDAIDLAILMEAIRKNGAWNGIRLVQPETVQAFTSRAFPEEDNRRGLGWDKPGLTEGSGASGNAGSWSSFGHSGFTGTLAWTDPEGEWTVVFLSNRVCPDATNRTLLQEDIRTKALFIVEEELGLQHRFETAAPEKPKPQSPR